MRLLIILIIAIQLSSCGRTYELDEWALEIIPYEGNEVLVFESNLNEYDTIFLTGFQRFKSHPHPLDIFQEIYEGSSLTCSKSDPNYDRYLDKKNLVSVSATGNREISLNFDITLKRSWFYDLNSYRVEQLDSIPSSNLIIGTRTYSDVKTFNATEYAKQFSERANYVERFYWSLTEGFLGLDRSDEQWRLIEKYVP